MKILQNEQQAQTSYKQIINNFNMYDSLLDEEQPILQINKLHYRETVYPPQQFAYTEKVRGRTNYENNFWRDARADRTTKGESKKPTNSQGFPVNQSSFALDGLALDQSFVEIGNAGIPAGYPTGGIHANNASGFKPGELQNLYTQFVRSSVVDGEITNEKNQLRVGALYSRKHIMSLTQSVVGFSGMADKIKTFGITAGANQILLTSSIGAGEAFWDAPRRAGRYEGTSSTFVVKAAKPFYDDYDSFFSDIKTKAGGRSIIPEFKISDHLKFYNDNGGNFLVENPKLLSITGVPTGSSLPQNTDEDDFFKIFTNSDFMKYFEVVREDADKDGGTLEAGSVKLRCKAIKKFVPYDGFYPAERTLQIAQEFSSSLGPYTVMSGSDSTKQGAFRTLLKPFFAPGIVYNTIKSGVAVDYPILTGSYNKTRLFTTDGSKQLRFASSASTAIFSNSRVDSQAGRSLAAGGDGSNRRLHGRGWDYRIPFEAIVEPSKYIYGKNIVDDEPSVLCSLDATASWGSVLTSPDYKYMMHNFLAETLNFYIKDGKPTEIVSERQKDFKPVTPGQHLWLEN